MEPFSAFLLAANAGLKIGGAIAGHLGQDEEFDANKDAALKALRLKRRDLSIRSIEEKTSASQRLSEGRRQAQKALGLSGASAAAGGVEGASVDAQEQAIEGDLGRFNQSVEFNLTANLDQIDRMRAGAEAEAEARINSVQRPSLLNTALQIGGVALNTFGTYRSFQPVGLDDPAPLTAHEEAVRSAELVFRGMHIDDIFPPEGAS